MSLETSGSSRLCTLHKCIITGMNKRIKRFKCRDGILNTQTDVTATAASQSVSRQRIEGGQLTMC